MDFVIDNILLDNKYNIFIRNIGIGKVQLIKRKNEIKKSSLISQSPESLV